MMGTASPVLRKSIAILVLAHRNKGQLVRLLRHLSPDFALYVHLDSKSPFAISAEEAPGARFIQPSDVRWAGYSMIEATLALLEAAAPARHERYVLISGQDLPIKTNAEIMAYFGAFPGKSLLEFEAFPRSCWQDEFGGYGRIRFHHFERSPRLTWWATRLVRYGFLSPKPLLHRYWGGSQWFNLTDEAVRLVLQTLKEHPGYAPHFRTSFCADEMFFQTLLLNSPLAGACVSDPARHLEWEGTDDGHPRTFELGHLERVMGASAPFARKFDETLDAAVIDAVYERLGRKAHGREAVHG